MPRIPIFPPRESGLIVNEGSDGPAVIALILIGQALGHGGEGLLATPDYGPRAKEMVKSWQRANRLEPDGQAGNAFVDGIANSGGVNLRALAWDPSMGQTLCVGRDEHGEEVSRGYWPPTTEG